MWDTENGPAYADEINLVKPGFNSGYTPVQGIWAHGVNPESNVSDWELFSDKQWASKILTGEENTVFPNLLGLSLLERPP